MSELDITPSSELIQAITELTEQLQPDITVEQREEVIQQTAQKIMATLATNQALLESKRGEN